jgi:oligopeptide transport system substrate-binding protein
MYRNLLGIGAVFLGALLLVGITFSSSKEKPADFRFINGSEPKSLDPHVVTGQLEGRLVDALFEGLTYRDPATLAPRPGCATSWDVSPDKRTYTFHMRKEARWSDGRRVTARDFAWSWKRLQEPSIGSEYAYILHCVKWARAYNLFAGHVRRLVGPVGKDDTPCIVDALEAFRKENPQGVQASAWQHFLGAHKVNDTVTGTPDALLQGALVQRQGRLDAARLEAVEQALRKEAERRRAVHAQAAKHFGVDGGAYAPDDDTFVVQLEAPTPYFLELTSFYSAMPVPRHLLEARAAERKARGEDEGKEDWFLPEHMVSNGPYRLAAWRVNDKIRLVRSETYWNKDGIRLRTIDAFPYENTNTALNVYLTGGADWTPTYPTSIVGALKDRPDFHSNPGMVVYYYRFNTTRKPFDDPRVRQAVCMAVNRQVIIDNILKLGQQPAFRLTPPGLGAYDPPPSALHYDPQEARKLLAEAGYPGGQGIRPLTLLYNTNEAHKTIAEEVAAQLKKQLGLDIQAKNQEWQMYQASTLALDYDIARAGWIGDYLDPNTFLDMWVTNGGNNQTGWSNALYDRLIAYAADIESFPADAQKVLPQLKEPKKTRALVEAMRTAPDPAARAAAGAKVRLQLFREAEAILFQDQFPVMPIYFYVVSSLVKPYVRGWRPNPQDIHPLRGLWIDEGAR